MINMMIIYEVDLFCFPFFITVVELLWGIGSILLCFWLFNDFGI